MRYSRGIGSEEELDEAERAYSEYLEKSSKAKNEIIGASAFEGCTSLKEVIIPASVKLVDETAFLGCEDITITYAEAEDSESQEGETDEDSDE